ncbi:unnamed protein product, partial [Gulo gulo]
MLRLPKVLGSQESSGKFGKGLVTVLLTRCSLILPRRSSGRTHLENLNTHGILANPNPTTDKCSRRLHT